MKTLTKISIPTAAVAAVAVGASLLMPRTALASPASVAKAIRDAKNYVISSFVIRDGKRTLQSKTTVVNGKSTRVLIDSEGKEVPATGNVEILKGGPDGRTVIKATAGSGAPTHGGHNVEVSKTKGADGVEKTVYKVDGKVVDKLPDELAAKVHAHIATASAQGGQGGHKVEVMATVGADGKEKTVYKVDGKIVDKLPEGMDAKVNVVQGHGPASGGHKVEVNETVGPDGVKKTVYKVDGKVVDKLPADLEGKVKVLSHNSDLKADGHSFTQEAMVIGKGNGKGGVNAFISGQTSVEDLLKMLDDSSVWNIERGVTLNGVKVDRFTLKGEMSPIELFVDPGSSLPKVLRFTPPSADSQIEDVYEYGPVPR